MKKRYPHLFELREIPDQVAKQVLPSPHTTFTGLLSLQEPSRGSWDGDCLGVGFASPPRPHPRLVWLFTRRLGACERCQPSEGHYLLHHGHHDEPWCPSRPVRGPMKGAMAQWRVGDLPLDSLSRLLNFEVLHYPPLGTFILEWDYRHHMKDKNTKLAAHHACNHINAHIQGGNINSKLEHAQHIIA
ncbi:hypothetical protein MTR67_026886 [Solanum verrucosum]|uniref:Uncharacterized protein n=1 Tax=Solanum verrucosum TaxID=315347 RepID=A0AAF0TUW7_SOLVR|nr:hypothetical protein MTR67_026886 [Solanum verrucosum]